MTGPQTLRVELGARAYPIHIGPGLLDRAALSSPHLDAGKVLIVSNDTVAPLYLERLTKTLGAVAPATLILPDGEEYKTLDTLARVLDALVDHGCGRDACLIALGGGVVGDIAGFGAACYQRGIDWIQVPTTLLAQVDSSVGGKTGVNHPAGKNLIGAFHQPVCVIADTDTLATLDPRHYRAGLAEVIKYGLILDGEFFDWLEENLPALLEREPDTLVHAIRRCCEIKAQVVAEDEQERSGRRALLNLGHTFGHAIERITGYGSWLHGEAVAAGTALAAETSRRLGGISEPDVARIVRLLERAGLPVRPPRAEVETLLEHMRLDKKALGGKLRLVLLDAVGQARVTDDFPPALPGQVLQDAMR